MKRLLLIAILGCCLSYSHAQSTLGFNLNGFIPTGELREDSPEIWGGGFSLELALKIKDSPVHLGGQFGFTRYGSEVRDGDHGAFLGDVRVRRNNEIAQGLAFVRIKPPVNNNIQPYFDFYSGVSYVYTRSSIREDALSDVFEESLDFDDLALNYGAGVGVEFFLNEFLSLDINFKALKGSRSQYLTPRSVSYDPQIEGYHFNIRESRLDHFSFGIGLKVLFSHIND